MSDRKAESGASSPLTAPRHGKSPTDLAREAMESATRQFADIHWIMSGSTRDQLAQRETIVREITHKMQCIVSGKMDPEETPAGPE